jgi:hypothetical protein
LNHAGELQNEHFGYNSFEILKGTVRQKLSGVNVCIKMYSFKEQALLVSTKERGHYWHLGTYILVFIRSGANLAQSFI